jgi:beta-glucosidase
MKKIFTVLIFFWAAVAQALEPYQNPELPIDRRVEDLLGRMTLEEKLGQLRGGIAKSVDDAVKMVVDDHYGFIVFSEIRAGGGAEAAEATRRFLTQVREKSRLKIDPVIVSCGAHGLQSKNGTEFTCGIGLAATWNPSLMAEIGDVLGKEHRSRGFNLMVAPRLYLTTDPRTGRTEEGYGEDPLLVARMTTPFVEGLQNNGVISVICLYPTEFGPGGRLCETLEISERDLRERYMYPFEQAVKVGKAAGIMPVYGAVNGVPVHGNPWLLDTILRKEWGFDGIVFNDYNANASFSGRLGIPDPTVKFVQARMNVEFPFLGAYDHKLDEAVKEGRVTIEQIDVLVRDILRVKARFGMLDPNYPLPDPAEAKALPESPETRALALEAARQGIVLLTNKNNTLPFDDTIKKLAVMGPMSNPVPPTTILGSYSGTPAHLVGMADGLLASGKAEVKVVKYPRRPDARRPVDAVHLFCDQEMKTPGLRARFYEGDNAEGAVVGEVELTGLDFEWEKILPPALAGKPFTTVIEGFLQYPPFIITEVDFSSRTTKGALSFEIGGLNIIQAKFGAKIAGKIKLEAGHVYPIKLIVTPELGEKRFALEWIFTEELWSSFFVTSPKEMEECVKVAEESDAAVICVGIVEGEAKDRTSLRLPGNQEELIRKVKAVGKPVIVVLVAGNAVEMLDWYQGVDAILTVWRPGMEGGTALAEVLFGDTNPSGRLPLSFPKTVGQLPLTYNRYPTARPGFYVDADLEALLPFGHGLGYTTFRYSNLQVSSKELREGDTLEVSFDLENTGKRAGTEVIQLYTRSWNTSVVRPVRELRAFERVSLEPGETRRVTLRVPSDQLKYFGVDYETGRLTRRILEPHELQIQVGPNSRNQPLKTTIQIK